MPLPRTHPHLHLLCDLDLLGFRHGGNCELRGPSASWFVAARSMDELTADGSRVVRFDGASVRVRPGTGCVFVCVCARARSRPGWERGAGCHAVFLCSSRGARARFAAG